MRRTGRVRDTKTPLGEDPRRGFLNELRGSPNGVAVSAQRQKWKGEVEMKEWKSGGASPIQQTGHANDWRTRSPRGCFSKPSGV
jgi:hypothetical protein